MKNIFLLSPFFFLAIIVSLFYQNCSGNNVNFQSISESNDAGSETICNPFDDDKNSSGNIENGLLAKLRIWNGVDDSKRNHVMNYFNPEHSSFAADNIFFNDLNVKPRDWTSGFAKSGEGPLTIGEEVLNEWFALEFTSEITLNENNEEGYYRLATLSDDGSIAWVKPDKESDNYEEHIDNDGTHAPTLACAKDTIYLSHNETLPIKIKYFQGPRTTISLMLLWQKLETNKISHEPECGNGGTDYFFIKSSDNNEEAIAKSPWISMKERGWQTLKKSNYRLPAGNINPCNLK